MNKRRTRDFFSGMMMLLMAVIGSVVVIYYSVLPIWISFNLLNIRDEILHIENEAAQYGWTQKLVDAYNRESLLREKLYESTNGFISWIANAPWYSKLVVSFIAIIILILVVRMWVDFLKPRKRG